MESYMIAYLQGRIMGDSFPSSCGGQEGAGLSPVLAGTRSLDLSVHALVGSWIGGRTASARG